MNKQEFRKLIREEIRKVIKEVSSPQETAMKVAIQKSIEDEEYLYIGKNLSMLSKKAGLTPEELEYLVIYHRDKAGEDEPLIDNLDAKVPSGRMTGYQMIDYLRKKLQGMSIDMDALN